jgi:hypothetical protein
MCPVCIATAAWIAAGATSTGGISALVVRRFRGNQQESTMNHQLGDSNGQEQQDPNKHE